MTPLDDDHLADAGDSSSDVAGAISFVGGLSREVVVESFVDRVVGAGVRSEMCGKVRDDASAATSRNELRSHPSPKHLGRGYQRAVAWLTDKAMFESSALFDDVPVLNTKRTESVGGDFDFRLGVFEDAEDRVPRNDVVRLLVEQSMQKNFLFELVKIGGVFFVNTNERRFYSRESLSTRATCGILKPQQH